jgi:succinylarginine dihydrolase
MVDRAKLDRIADVIAQHWPDEIRSNELQRPALFKQIEAARAALLDVLDLGLLANG